MKSKSALLALILWSLFFVILANCRTKKTANFDFRRASWGMSPTAVKKGETGKFLNVMGNNMAFRDTMFGNSFFIVYSFEKDKLYMAGMVCEQEYAEEKKFEDNFVRLKNELAKELGKPVIDKVFKQGEKLKKFREAWGRALTADDRVMVCHWISEDRRTQCTLILDNDKELKNTQIVFKDMRYMGFQSAYEIFLSPE